MSIPTFAWAREQGATHQLATATRCLLMVLADMARLDEGRLLCRALQSTLSRETGIKQRSLILHLQRLEASGLIAIEPCGRSQNYVILRAANGADNAHVEPENGADNAHVAGNGADSAHVIPSNGANPAPIGPQTGANPAHVWPIEPRHVQNLTTTCAKSAPPYLEENQEREERKEPPPISPPSGVGGRDRSSGSVAFETFWLAYPRKAGKRAALKCWDGATKRAGGAEAIMAGLAGHRFQSEERFIPHPATWLNRDQWLDVQAPQQPAKSVYDQIREDWGLTSFLTPIIDDDEPPARHVRLVS